MERSLYGIAYFMDTIGERFAKNLRAYLDDQPYGTISKLAKQLDVDQSTISNWAAGRRKSTEEQRRKVAKLLKIKYEDLIGLDSRENENKEISEPSFSELANLYSQQEAAWKINHDLIQLEKIDPKELQEVHYYILFRLHRKKAKSSQSMGLTNDPGDN